MEAVGPLSGGIAHDFNNMLTIILGNIDIALQRIGGDNPRVQRALQAARAMPESRALPIVLRGGRAMGVDTLYASIPDISPSRVKESKAFLEDFWKTISDDRRAKYEIVEECQKLGM